MIRPTLLILTLLTTFGCASNATTAKKSPPPKGFVGQWYTDQHPQHVDWMTMRINKDRTLQMQGEQNGRIHTETGTWKPRGDDTHIIAVADASGKNGGTIKLVDPDTLVASSRPIPKDAERSHDGINPGSSHSFTITFHRITTPIANFLGHWQSGMASLQLNEHHLFYLKIKKELQMGFKSSTYSGNWQRTGDTKIMLQAHGIAKSFNAALFDPNTLIVNVLGHAYKLHRTK